MMKKVNQYILKAKHIFIELYLFIFLDIKTDFKHAKPIQIKWYKKSGMNKYKRSKEENKTENINKNLNESIFFKTKKALKTENNINSK